ncbi:hypothetical protein F4775DRAFT_595597 [Biscogniauxia sp. FL1348]|nr:hypothetical protein F4775DRAFT_595597 [Biscogniauxia sp. FL1348]
MAGRLSCWALVGLVTGLQAAYLPQLRDDSSSNINSHTIMKRDPCNGLGADYEIGRTYTQVECPALQETMIDGSCDYTKRQAHDTQCAFFCQDIPVINPPPPLILATKFDYMTEQPLDHTYCRGPRTCMINQDKTVYSGWQWSGSDTERWALEQGVSGGFSGAVHTLMAGPGSIPIAENECGYFTYIGVQKTVCGTLTTAGLKTTDANNTSWCLAPATTTPSVCVSDVRTPAGGADPPTGTTVFVRVDCGTRAPLAERQDGAYGPARMDAGALDGVLQGWVATSCDVWYKFFFNEFDVRGRGFKDELLGPALDGAGLRDRINHCGDVTNWGFEYTPDDPDYDWYAWGRTPIGTRSCIGSAVVDIGGSAGNCVGAG